MTRYTVLWREDVQNDLAQLWLQSTRRQQISTAADQIDAELLIDAHLKGQAVAGGGKAISIPPLVARFRVDDGDRKVYVEAIDLDE